jgi:hypothetical protein
MSKGEIEAVPGVPANLDCFTGEHLVGVRASVERRSDVGSAQRAELAFLALYGVIVSRSLTGGGAIFFLIAAAIALRMPIGSATS